VRRKPEIPRDIFFGDAAAENPPRAEPGRVRAVGEDKIQVTIYLSEAAVKRLEALRFHLLNEYNLKLSKSALAEYAILRLGEDVEALARQFGGGGAG